MVRFVDDDLSGSEFREVVLNRSRFVGVVMQDAEIDGLVTNLVVNGVEVTGYVQAELDRLHPVRVLIRSDEPDDLREAWATLCAAWATTLDRLAALPSERAHASVDGEWSAVQTLRHLLFVHDSWFARAVLGRRQAFHPWGLASDFVPHQDAMGLDPGAAPRWPTWSARAASATTPSPRSSRARPPRSWPGRPRPRTTRAWPPHTGTVARCLRVVLDEEWAHHGFCVRDLDRLDAADGQGSVLRVDQVDQPLLGQVVEERPVDQHRGRALHAGLGRLVGDGRRVPVVGAVGDAPRRLLVDAGHVGDLADRPRSAARSSSPPAGSRTCAETNAGSSVRVVLGDAVRGTGRPGRVPRPLREPVEDRDRDVLHLDLALLAQLVEQDAAFSVSNWLHAGHMKST